MGMGLSLNDGLQVFMLIFSVFLLVLTYTNHSRDTRRYRILKLGLRLLVAGGVLDLMRSALIRNGSLFKEPLFYVVIVGYYLCVTTVMIQIMMYMLMQLPQLEGHDSLLYTIFFLSESIAVVLLLSTSLTGFAYSIRNGRVITGMADAIFYVFRLVVLCGFVIAVWVSRRRLSQKLFQNWMVMLVISIAIHLLPFVLKGVQVFGFFANVYWAVAFFMFHCGTYEEGTARMGADMYRSELDFYLSSKKNFYIFEIQIRNYDQLVERRLYSEEELNDLYSMFATRLTGVTRGLMLFWKKHTSLGVIAPDLYAEEAEQLAANMHDWMGEFFAGQLTFGIAAASCPKYASQFVDAERLLRFLQKKCPVNNYYFCEEADYEEFRERDEILRLLHDMHLEKEDVVLFGRPIIDCSSAHATCFEILCRLQMAGSGIIHSEHVIRLAEQYGYIHDVNMAVLAKVCDFLITDTAIREKIRVSLHISGEELENPGFARDVREIIKDYELAPGLLEFEVTMVPGEGDINRMREVMRTLCRYQISFVLTDFDPMNVNFENVMGLPFKMIKFERHCIKRASESAACYDVTGMLVDLFKDHGFHVGFKGIDNGQLEEIAVSLRADFLQGEKYTKPFPIEQMETVPDLQAMF